MWAQPNRDRANGALIDDGRMDQPAGGQHARCRLRCDGRHLGRVRSPERGSCKTLHSLRLRRLSVQAPWVCAHERRPAGLHQGLHGEERRRPAAAASQVMMGVAIFTLWHNARAGSPPRHLD